MSYKASKSLKKFPSEQSEQLDFVETINDVDKAKKKRLSIIIFLLLTVGISLCFIIYRQVKNINFREFKIPDLSLKLPTLSQPKFSPAIPENWSVFVQSIGNTDYSYSFNFTSGDFTKIKTLHDPSFAKKYLPDGVAISEKTNISSDFLEIFSIISTPKNKFQIYTKIPGKIDYNSPEADTFSKLVESFYWHLLK